MSLERPCGPPSLLCNKYRLFPWGKTAGVWPWHPPPPHSICHPGYRKSCAWTPPLGLLDLLVNFTVTKMHCATSRKVASSIPYGVIGTFHWLNPYGRTVALRSTELLTKMISACFLEGEGGRCLWLITLATSVCWFCRNCGILNLLEHWVPLQACTRIHFSIVMPWCPLIDICCYHQIQHNSSSTLHFSATCFGRLCRMS